MEQNQDKERNSSRAQVITVPEEEKRDQWSKPIEFVLALLGYAVGLGNIWRFPYMCMRNGGGAFVFAYFFCLFFSGIPFYFLELCIGQQSRRSCITCWEVISPVVKGVGYGMVLLSAVFVLYYHIIFSWILYYMAVSFTSSLPWTTCSAWWNTPNCVLTLGDKSGANLTAMNISYSSYEAVNGSLVNISLVKPVTAAEEFWQHGILEITDGITDLGGLKWQLVVAHVVGWIGVYFCVIRGVKSVGKVVYVTATAPYIFIFILLIRAVMLPGSWLGISYYITPNFDKLGDPQLWIEAFLQIFYSLGPSWGGLITMASYNNYHHDIFRDAILAPIATCMTSFVAGFIVFSVAGFLATQSGVDVSEAISSGPGLAFIAYPEAVAHLPGAPFWAVLFFIMLIFVGLDTQFVTLETLISAINDEFNQKTKARKIMVVTIVCVTMCIIGLVFCTRGGMYIFQIVDWFLTILAMFVFCIFECLVMTWLYGYKRLYDDLNDMIGRRPLKFILVPLWGVILPILLITALTWTMVKFTSPTYGGYEYPAMASRLGWLLSCMSVIPVPIVAVIQVYRTPGNSLGQKIKRSIRPYVEDQEQVEKPWELERMNDAKTANDANDAATPVPV